MPADFVIDSDADVELDEIVGQLDYLVSRLAGRHAIASGRKRLSPNGSPLVNRDDVAAAKRFIFAAIKAGAEAGDFSTSGIDRVLQSALAETCENLLTEQSDHVLS